MFFGVFRLKLGNQKVKNSVVNSNKPSCCSSQHKLGTGKQVIMENANENTEATIVLSDDEEETKQQSKSVLLKIARMSSMQLLADITLVVGEVKYTAHRAILSESSDVRNELKNKI
jgi:BTB/POZ domain